MKKKSPRKKFSGAPIFIAAQILLFGKFTAAHFVKSIVDIESRRSRDVIEGDGAAAFNRERERSVAILRFAVLAVNNLEHIAVRVVENNIIARARFVKESIVAVAAPETVISCAAPKAVISCLTVKHVIARAARQSIGSVAAVKSIVLGAARD